MTQKTLLMIMLIPGFFIFSCAKSPVISYTVYEPPAKQLDSSIKTIILHEDYIQSDQDQLNLRPLIIQKLFKALKFSKRFQVHYYKSGRPIKPVLGKSAVFFGNIYSQEASSNGRTAKVTRKSRSGRGYSESWDVLETIQWKNSRFQAIARLHLFEMSETPGMINDSIALFSYSKTTGEGNAGTRQNIENNDFLHQNKNKESKSFDTGERVLSFKPVGSMKKQKNQIAEDLVQQYLKNIMTTKVIYEAEAFGFDSEVEKLFKEKKYTELRSILKKRLDESGEDKKVEDLFLLGLSYEAGSTNREDVEEALRLYKSAIKADPSPLAIYKGVARTERLLGLTPSTL